MSRLVALSLTLLAVPAVAQPTPFTLDFESGDLQGWTKTGAAFDEQPTFGDNPTARNRGQPSGHQGSWWIGGFEKFQNKPGQKAGAVRGDGPTGTLTSAPFTITAPQLSFLVGGGSSDKTRVELVVNGAAVLRASGKNTETMARVTWDLTPFSGKQAMLRIVDEASGGWGHINVDDFRFDGESAAAPGDLTGTWRCNDGGTYYLRQLDDQVWWYGESAGGGRAWTNVFFGRREGNQLIGRWADVPKGGARAAGEMTLTVQGNKLSATKRTGGFGGSEWSR